MVICTWDIIFSLMVFIQGGLALCKQYMRFNMKICNTTLWCKNHLGKIWKGDLMFYELGLLSYKTLCIMFYSNYKVV